MGRNKEVKLKYTQREGEVLESKAKRLGLKPVQFIRMVSLNSDIKVENETN
jgi:hypothetical protein